MSSLERSARRTRLVVGLVVVVVLAAGAWLAYLRLVRERWAGPLREQEARAAAAVETFCAADAELATDPFFQPGPRAKDAAAWLNPLVGFGSTSVDGGVPIPPGTLEVPDALRTALGTAENFLDADLADAGVEDALAAVDTSAFSRAHEFDHWELTGAGSPLVAAASWNGAEAPLPRFIQLIAAAKVHLVKGARAGTLPQAAKDVRQLARLCLTTESLIGAMVGVALAGVEGRAHEWAVAHQVDVADWTPVDGERLNRAKAVFKLAGHFLGPMANEATFGRVLECAAVSRCVGLSETVVLGGGLAGVFPEPAASRVKAGLGVVSSPGKGCSFATARYFAARPMTPGIGEVEPWMPKDMGGLLLMVAASDVAPLDVLVDAGVPVVTK